MSTKQILIVGGAIALFFLFKRGDQTRPIGKEILSIKVRVPPTKEFNQASLKSLDGVPASYTGLDLKVNPLDTKFVPFFDIQMVSPFRSEAPKLIHVKASILDKAATDSLRENKQGIIIEVDLINHDYYQIEGKALVKTGGGVTLSSNDSDIENLIFGGGASVYRPNVALRDVGKLISKRETWNLWIGNRTILDKINSSIGDFFGVTPAPYKRSEEIRPLEQSEAVSTEINGSVIIGEGQPLIGFGPRRSASSTI